MASPSNTAGSSSGLPQWVVSSIGIVGLSLGGLFVAGQLGHYMGAQAAADALQERRLVAERGPRNLRDAPATVVPATVPGQTSGRVDVADRQRFVGSQPQADPRLSVRRGSNFVSLPLPKGVTVELPKNWVALTKNQRVTLDSVVESQHDLAGITRPESDLPFAANYLDDARNVAAMFNVRFYPQEEWTQDFVRGLSADELAELDRVGRASTEAQQANGLRLLEWRGTVRREINGIAAFLVEYRRAGDRAGTTFCVRLVRVVNAGKSFTATVSYREDSERLLRPICDRIIESINQR